MKPSQAKVLLHIAENTSADGDEVLAESNRIRQMLLTHAKRILEDEDLLTQAWNINQRDKERFMAYIPQEHRPVQQVGQRPELAAGRPSAAITKLMQEVRDEKRPNQKAEAGN